MTGAQMLADIQAKMRELEATMPEHRRRMMREKFELRTVPDNWLATNKHDLFVLPKGESTIVVGAESTVAHMRSLFPGVQDNELAAIVAVAAEKRQCATPCVKSSSIITSTTS